VATGTETRSVTSTSLLPNRGDTGQVRVMTILKPRWDLHPQADRRRSAEVVPTPSSELNVASL
jgi:hypothetical protein